jgi:hypothetical protein
MQTIQKRIAQDRAPKHGIRAFAIEDNLRTASADARGLDWGLEEEEEAVDEWGVESGVEGSDLNDVDEGMVLLLNRPILAKIERKR